MISSATGALLKNKHPAYIYLPPAIVILLSFLAMCGSPLYGQKKQPFFQQLSTPEGLSHPDVHAIESDQQGFLWIGTSHGLNRYDGYQFVSFTKQQDNPTSLAGNKIRALQMARDNVLWVGSNVGLQRFDTTLESFENFPIDSDNPIESDNLIDSDNLRANDITDLALDASGLGLWVASAGGLHYLDFATKTFGSFYAEKQPEGLISNDLMTLHASPAGHGVWLAGTAGVLQYLDASKNQFLSYAFADGDPAYITALEFDSTGRLWVATNGRGLCYLDDKKGQLVELETWASLGAPTVYALKEDAAGNFWVGTWSEGLFPPPSRSIPIHSLCP